MAAIWDVPRDVVQETSLYLIAEDHAFIYLSMYE
jgi:hypothetical protein